VAIAGILSTEDFKKGDAFCLFLLFTLVEEEDQKLLRWT